MTYKPSYDPNPIIDEFMVEVAKAPKTKSVSTGAGVKGFRSERTLVDVPKIGVFVGILSKYIEQSGANGPQQLMAAITLLGNAFTQAYPDRQMASNLLNLFRHKFKHISTTENVEEAKKLSQRLLLLSAKVSLPPTDLLGGMLDLEDAVAKRVLDERAYRNSRQWFSLSSLTQMMTEKYAELPPRLWAPLPQSSAEGHRVDIVNNWLNLKVASGYSRLIRFRIRAGTMIWFVEVPSTLIEHNVWQISPSAFLYRVWVTNNTEGTPMTCREYLQDSFGHRAGHWYLHCNVVHPVVAQAATVIVRTLKGSTLRRDRGALST